MGAAGVRPHSASACARAGHGGRAARESKALRLARGQATSARASPSPARMLATCLVAAVRCCVLGAGQQRTPACTPCTHAAAQPSSHARRHACKCFHAQCALAPTPLVNTSQHHAPPPTAHHTATHAHTHLLRLAGLRALEGACTVRIALVSARHLPAVGRVGVGGWVGGSKPGVACGGCESQRPPGRTSPLSRKEWGTPAARAQRTQRHPRL